MFEKYPDLCTVDEMCDMLRFGRTKAFELLKNGTIPSHKIQGKYCIPKGAIVQYYLKQYSRGDFPPPPASATTFYRVMRK